MDPRPHGLTEVGLDEYTRSMHKNVPLSWQRGFRDNGHFKAVADHSVLLAAAMMVPYYGRFLTLGSRQRSYQYGETHEHSVHVIDLCKSDEIMETESKSTTSKSMSKSKARRVLLFVHGGAWGSGKPWMYRLSAAGLAKCIDAEVVILIQYKVYPHNHILEQRDDIMSAINFIKSNKTWKPDWLQRAGGHIDLILSGHSSGANISALAIFKAMEDGYRLVDEYIGLSGVYHLYKHYLWEKARGVHLISPMRGAAETAGGFDLCSPTRVLESKFENAESKYRSEKKGEREEVGEHFLIDQRALLPNIFILHGVDDRTVPISSSLEFAHELTLKGVRVHTAFVPGMDHGTPIVELIDQNCKSTPTGLALTRWNKESSADEVTTFPFPTHRAKL